MAEQLAFLSGITERARILAQFEHQHPLYLSVLRAYAHEIAVKNGVVTVDDIYDKMDETGFPRPEEVGIAPRIFGRLLSGCKELEACGEVKTRRAEWAARVGSTRDKINVYRIKRVKEEVA